MDVSRTIDTCLILKMRGASNVLQLWKKLWNTAIKGSVGSAFAYREQGILAEETTRQTDSGSDIDAKESHALHIELV